MMNHPSRRAKSLRALFLFIIYYLLLIIIIIIIIIYDYCYYYMYNTEYIILISCVEDASPG